MQALIRGLSKLRNPPPRNGSALHYSKKSSTDPPRSASFGFRTVPDEAKEKMVREIFDSVASKYDWMNDIASVGVHRLWRNEFVASLQPGRRGPQKCIDVAGGTADIAVRILDFAREKYACRETTVDIVDINGQMLKEGYNKFTKTIYHNSTLSFRSLPLGISSSITAPQVSFTEGDAQQLSKERFPNNTYDIYTIAFGIRNCTSISAVLEEAYRVLKPGGIFACLEFSRVDNLVLRT